jgi:nucleotide-binding universal stress UspA family protein
MMKLLIAYDGSECAAAALEDLRRAGLEDDTEVLVFTVGEEWPAYTFTGFGIPSADADRNVSDEKTLRTFNASYRSKGAVDCAAHAVQRLNLLCPRWKVSFDTCIGAPFTALVHAASEEKADLIVLGSHGRSALGRAFFGSVSHYVVNHAACSIRIARSSMFPNYEKMRIIIGLDGSDASWKTVKEVAGRKWPEDTEVCIVTALDNRFLDSPGVSNELLPRYLTSVEKHLNRLLDATVANASNYLKEHGLRVTSCRRPGAPSYVLVEEADTRKADVIFLGARGHGTLERLLLGSVSSAVAQHAHCTVEIVR